MFHQQAVFDSQDVSDNPVAPEAMPGKASVQDDVVAFGHSEPRLISQTLRKRFYEIEKSIAASGDVRAVLDVSGRPQRLSGSIVTFVEQCVKCAKRYLFIGFVIHDWSLVTKSIRISASEISDGPRMSAGNSCEGFKNLIGADVFTCGQVAVAVEYTLHVCRFGARGQDVAKELRWRTRVIREWLTQSIRERCGHFVKAFRLVAEPISLARMPLRVRETVRCDCGYIIAIHPTQSRIAHVMPDDAFPDVTLTAVPEKVLHEYLRPQMGKRHPRPLDVALDELVPAIMSDPRIVTSACAQVNDLFNASLLCHVHQILALAKHVDGIPGRHKDPVDSLERRSESLDSVQVQRDHRDPQMAGLCRIARRRYDAQLGIRREERRDGTSYLSRRSHDQHSRLVAHDFHVYLAAISAGLAHSAC